MVSYLNNIPQGTDFLDFSWTQLLSNFGALDTIYGIDHYAYSYSLVPANQGFHNTVTEPLIVGSVHPATSATVCKVYTMQDTAPLGLLQYSRGPSSPIPTPVTELHSTAAAISILNGMTTNVLDFTGIPRAFCTLYAGDSVVFPSQTFGAINVFWTGSAFAFNNNNSALTAQASTNILQLKNNAAGGLNYSNVYWTLRLHRLQ